MTRDSNTAKDRPRAAQDPSPLRVMAAPSAPLTLPGDEMRALGYAVIDAIVTHIEGLTTRPVAPTLPTAPPRPPSPPPEHGTAPATVLAATRAALQDAVAHDHPRFFAMVPSPGNFVSAMADALTAGFNNFGGLARMSPAGNAMELEALEWLRTLCGLDPGASGVFVSGASAATLISIVVAREQILGAAEDDLRGARIYGSTATHPVLDRGAKIAGLGPSCVRRLPVDDALRLDVAALERAIRDDRAAGRRPFLVVANAGTTDTGAVDDLPALARVCRAEGLWLHVDGAYGAAAALTERGRALLRGLELADSLALDPHKWLFQPYELGCLLLRRPQLLEQTLRLRANYFDHIERRDQSVDFKDRGIQLTRSLKALKLWMSLTTFGVAAFRQAIDHGLDLAQHAADELRDHPDWHLVTPPQLAVLTFRYLPGDLAGAALDAVQQRLCDDLTDSGFAMLNTTLVRGVRVLRMCTLHPRATEADVRAVVRWLARRALELRAAHR